MRRPVLAAIVLACAWTAIPLSAALAQAKDDPEADASAKKKKEDEWGDQQAPLPALRNAGPCPFVKVLYDAARYVELKDNTAAFANVGYTGEIQGLSSTCQYKDDQPIRVQMQILFALGKGPEATSNSKTYRYWVAVTDRNNAVIAKEYFDLPVTFTGGVDRTLVTDNVYGVTIPRGRATVSGSNFEVLVGFDVTPTMVAFNRDGKRFRANAGQTSTAATAAPGQTSNR